MLIQLLIGTFMIGATVMLHALALDVIIRNAKKMERLVLHRVQGYPWKPFALAASVLAILAAHVVEIWMWTAVFVIVSAFPNLEVALYFSTTAFTTVGFGDVLPSVEWRLLGPIEAANGFMLFGWSTAFTFEIVSQLYRKEGETLRTSGKQ